jgi:hypothetical protein
MTLGRPVPTTGISARVPRAHRSKHYLSSCAMIAHLPAVFHDPRHNLVGIYLQK